MEKVLEIQIQAAETLLDRGVKVGGVEAPFFFRLWGQKNICIRLYNPTLGGSIAIVRELLQMQIDPKKLGGLTEREAMELMNLHGNRLCRIVAISMLKRKRLIRWFTGKLSRWLLWHVKPLTLVKCVHVLWVNSGVRDFTTTIRFLQGANVLEANLSPEDQGSQEAG